MTMKAREKAVSAAEFKSKCLALFDDAESRRRTYVVTKRGRPVARVVPLPRKTGSSLRGSLIYEEDLLAPVDVEWNAARV
ncbi:MAG TPA: type II toxin-antitoxin system prevent-host-death family antitoxin [Labilithrix sp.]|nr:type II toxin-antitoxin system prevent-host-death family antitoxin [Labilithrix sp.]